MAGGQVISVAGEVLTAARVNTYWMDQAVMRVTSGTRPTAAAQGGALLLGMAIFETDTYKLLQYTTATTLWVPPWNLPWGYIGQVQLAADTGSIAATADVTGLTVTWTTVQNRRYRTVLDVQGNDGASSDIGYAITDGSNTVLKTERHTTGASGVSHQVLMYLETAASSASATRKARVVAGTITTLGASGYASSILVEDLGNGGAPA